MRTKDKADYNEDVKGKGYKGFTTASNLLFKHPITAPLKVLIFFSMGIIAVQYINASNLIILLKEKLNVSVEKSNKEKLTIRNKRSSGKER